MTKSEGCDIITELSERDGSEKSRLENDRKNLEKKLQKSLKNLLTNDSECDIINKPSERGQQNPQKRMTKSAQRCAKSPKLIEN